MSVSCLDQQIKTAYEIEGLSPENIYEAFNGKIELVGIKAKLMQVSSKYREDCGADSDKDVDFTNDQLRQINQVIFETALVAEHPDGSPDYRTRLKAAEYIRDDKKGRKEIRRVIQNTNFNLLQFNEAIKNAQLQAGNVVRELIDIR